MQINLAHVEFCHAVLCYSDISNAAFLLNCSRLILLVLNARVNKYMHNGDNWDNFIALWRVIKILYCLAVQISSSPKTRIYLGSPRYYMDIWNKAFNIILQSIVPFTLNLIYHLSLIIEHTKNSSNLQAAARFILYCPSFCIPTMSHGTFVHPIINICN